MIKQKLITRRRDNLSYLSFAAGAFTATDIPYLIHDVSSLKFVEYDQIVIIIIIITIIITITIIIIIVVIIIVMIIIIIRIVIEYK